MNRLSFSILSAAILLAHPALGSGLNLPANAQQMQQTNSSLDSYIAPIGPFKDGAMKTKLIEGEVERSSWRVVSTGVTTLQVLALLRDQLIEAGYDVLLDCDQNTCGGFDFRFGTEVLPAPDMYVNIRAFRFLTAAKPNGASPSEVVSLLVSTSGTAAFVQIIQAGSKSGQKLAVTVSGTVLKSTLSALPAGVELKSNLLRTGSVVLNDLAFASGTSDLGQGPFPVLDELAAFYKSRDDIRIILVGHTDSDGALDFNIELSKSRAASVRKRLLDEYGLDAARISAEGIGFLGPIRSNLDAEGRKANRRVEAIILPLR
jgi:outer membrane protein OmpA-like peptidoglycan-associated protein